VIRNWEQFRGEASPYTWMYRITTNYCLNQLRNRQGRARKRVEHHHDIAPEDPSWDPDGLDAEAVRDLLAAEDDETRRIVVHLYFDEMTREQTAIAVGLSVPTVRKRLAAFTRRAQRALGAPTAAIASGALLFLLTRTLLGA
jgi:RNA polymerase sigma factor (sigma-70 family)